MQYVYLLRCIDNSIYVGCTPNLEQRLVRYQKGEVKYSSTRLPVQVETSVAFSEKYKAFQLEKYLKSGSGRAFMKWTGLPKDFYLTEWVKLEIRR